MKEYIVAVEDDERDFEEVFVGHIRKQTELIRCKDCAHYIIDQLKKDGTEDKRYSPSVCLFRISRNSPDWYCADAERKKK